MSRVEVRLTKEEKEAWRHHCNLADESEAKMLRKMMRLAMKEQDYNPEHKVQKRNKKAVISFRVSDEDHAKIFERSVLEGYSTPSQWSRSLIKSALKDDPILPDDALYVLSKSNSQLASIGRNLNQITRVLNTDHSAVDALKKDMIIALSTILQEHRKSVNDLIHYNYDPLNTNEKS